jgi:DNA polymerase-4
MFEARKLCPHAAIVPPDMAKYSEVGRQVRNLMLALTPLVEPLSIDEAFMDLSGTERLHGLMPAKSLARFAQAVERELGITVSIGLAPNKVLAKVASDLDKPRGFAVLGSEAATVLADKPVSIIFGVGKVAQARLQQDGIRLMSDLQRMNEAELFRRLGPEGARLSRLARGLDDRRVSPDREAKGVSNETTFAEDTADFDALERILWRLSEKVSARLKAAALAGSTITLKLKTTDFRLRTRARSLEHPTKLAANIFAVGRDLLAKEATGTRFRLLGIGMSSLIETDQPDRGDLIDRRTADAEQAMDRLRAKFGRGAVVRGLGFEPHVADEDDDDE